MKRKKILLLGACIFICTAASAIYFYGEILDKYYELKYPPVTEYYEVIDNKWTETQDTSVAEYFRRISYDESDNPIGLVRDYFISGAPQWRGHVLSVKPFVRQGRCEWFYENGNLKRSGVFEANKENGPFAHYYESGGLKEKGRKVNDELEGQVTAYYENGQVQYSGKFLGGLTNGIFRIYKQDGTPLPQELYRKDTILLVAFDIKEMIDNLGENEAITTGEYYLGGEYYLEQNDYVNAIEYYSEAINSYENYTKAYHQRGIAYYYNNQFSEAISDFNSGISLDHPEKYHLKYLVGSCKMYQEEVDTAIIIFHEAIAMCPQNISGNKTTSLAYNRIGDIYLDSEQYSLAIQNYSSAIDADSENSYLYSDRAWAYLSSDIDSLQILALDDCNLSIQINDKNDDAYTYAAIYYANNNQLQTALSYAQTAKKINPNNSQAQNVYQNVYAVLYPPRYSSPSYASSGEINWLNVAIGAYTVYSAYETIQDIRHRRWGDAAAGLLFDAALYFLGSE